MRSKLVALGIGSNLGHPIENLRCALSKLKKCSLLNVISVSSIYESDALLPEHADQAWNKNYLNAVVLCQCDLSIKAEDILQKVKAIEVEMGRLPSERWAPRLIDIDIVYWSEASYKSEKLQIPHEKFLERPFVLLPLLEVWPHIDIQHPSWSREWVFEKPFGTQKSKKYFWPKLVGILNITSDSFSDAGDALTEEGLHLKMNQLIEGGAEIIDIGAESTRPGAVEISVQDEFEKLNWALSKIKEAGYNRALSLDCRRPDVVYRVLSKYKIDYLNDVTGFDGSAMQEVLKDSRLPAFVMHSLSIPPDAVNTLSLAESPCLQLSQWWSQKQDQLVSAGILDEKLIFDPGIGFGKTKEQNLYILRHLSELSDIKNDVMIGHSRKSFQTLFSDHKPRDRDLVTALLTQNLNQAFVQYLRVHNIEAQILALKTRSNYE